MIVVRYHMKIFREHDPDEPAEKRSKTVTNLAGITGAYCTLWRSFLLHNISSFERHFTFSPKVLEVTQVRSQRDKLIPESNPHK